MITLQFFDGKKWNDCGKWLNEAMAWVSLGGDDKNYRTIDETGKVLTDKSKPITTQAKILAIYDFVAYTMKKKAVHFQTTKIVETTEPTAIISKIKAVSIDHTKVWIMTNDGKWSVVHQGLLYADIICDRIAEWLLQEHNQ